MQKKEQSINIKKNKDGHHNFKKMPSLPGNQRKLVKILKFYNAKHWPGYRKMGSFLYCWWGRWYK